MIQTLPTFRRIHTISLFLFFAIAEPFEEHGLNSEMEKNLLKIYLLKKTLKKILLFTFVLNFLIVLEILLPDVIDILLSLTL